MAKKTTSKRTAKDSAENLLHIGSSNIWKAGYDRSKRQIVMYFINRKTWRYTYLNVPIRVWTGFLKAESKGVYFARNIKDTFKNRRRIIKQ